MRGNLDVFNRGRADGDFDSQAIEHTGSNAGVGARGHIRHGSGGDQHNQAEHEGEELEVLHGCSPFVFLFS